MKPQYKLTITLCLVLLAIGFSFVAWADDCAPGGILEDRTYLCTTGTLATTGACTVATDTAPIFEAHGDANINHALTIDGDQAPAIDGDLTIESDRKSVV